MVRLMKIFLSQINEKTIESTYQTCDHFLTNHTSIKRNIILLCIMLVFFGQPLIIVFTNVHCEMQHVSSQSSLRLQLDVIVI